MNKLLLGTSNSHKVNEIKSIFKNHDFNVEILTPIDFNFTKEPIEDGLTFEENAVIKAKFYYDNFRIPCVCEDSGICIEYLNNFPGIYSKRFMSTLSDYEKNKYILELMNGITNRKAAFHDVLCFIDANGDVHTFKGINYGEISLQQTDGEGFGYDPIFYIPQLNKTEAQLGNDYKNEHSHRAIAFKEFINYAKKSF